jgi:hypothetical protein
MPDIDRLADIHEFLRFAQAVEEFAKSFSGSRPVVWHEITLG